MSILSLRDPFAGRVLFWVLLLEKIKNEYGTLCLALPKLEMGLVFWVTVVGDNLS
jgi:hypothetical protein